MTGLRPLAKRTIYTTDHLRNGYVVHLHDVRCL